jgi:cytochrome c oxidase subunit IV
MSSEMDTSEKIHGPKYGKYILIWLALMMLTVVTVTVAGINFGPITVATAITIASVKSYLVLTVFMHLNVEQVAFKLFVGVALVFIIISLVLLFADYSFM